MRAQVREDSDIVISYAGDRVGTGLSEGVGKILLKGGRGETAYCAFIVVVAINGCVGDFFGGEKRGIFEDCLL